MLGQWVALFFNNLSILFIYFIGLFVYKLWCMCILSGQNAIWRGKCDETVLCKETVSQDDRRRKSRERFRMEWK
jgi:hypothetical protein